MKRLLVLVLAFSVLCLPMEARRRWIPKAVSGDGPNVWYESVAEASATTAQSGNTNDLVWDVVAVAQAGTATKLRFKCAAHFGGSESVIAALYDGTTLASPIISSGSVAVTSTGLFEVTLAAPTAVTVKSYAVSLSWVGSSADLARTATNTYSRNNASPYSGAPYAVLPAEISAPAGDLYVAIYVD